MGWSYRALLPSAVAIWITGATVYYLGGYCAYRSIVEMIRWRRAASKALGINIKFPNGTPAPPSKPERYLAWCESHNLHPYPFRPLSAGLASCQSSCTAPVLLA